MEANRREGTMEPSWTFPIPQAMQQHRGLQLQKPAPAKLEEIPLREVGASPPIVPVRSETHELIWG